MREFEIAGGFANAHANVIFEFDDYELKSVLSTLWCESSSLHECVGEKSFPDAGQRGISEPYIDMAVRTAFSHRVHLTIVDVEVIDRKPADNSADRWQNYHPNSLQELPSLPTCFCSAGRMKNPQPRSWNN